MNHLNINVPKNVRIAVVGDIHEHYKHFFKLIDLLQPDENLWLISVGDIYHKGFGSEYAEKITDKLIKLNKKNLCFAVQGNHELKEIRFAKKENRLTKQLNWWKEQPLALSLNFAGGSKLTVVHAGITPKHTWKDLINNNVEIAYIREIDENFKMIPLKWVEINGAKTLVKSKEGTNWHELYDGRFGYIAAGHAAQKDGMAKFYNYSCNLDSAVYETGILTTQIFDNGKKTELIKITDIAANPELNVQC